MRERRLKQTLFLIACVLCTALLFRTMRKLPDIKDKNGWTPVIHQILLMQAEKTVAPVLAMKKRMKDGCLETAFLHVAAPVIPYVSERDARGLAKEEIRQEVENPAGREKAQGEDKGTNDGIAWEHEKIMEDGEPCGDERNAADGGDADMEDAGGWMESGITPQNRLADKKLILDAETMKSFDSLVKNFYVIDSTTMADGALLNAERFLAKDLRIDQTGKGPQILIYHTHSQEGYADKGNTEATVVGAGRELTRILEEDYGYRVMHHEGVYDLPSRNGAYSRALPEVERILAENPDIQVVIDLHRDEMPENIRLVTEVDGKKTARFMFFNGISRTRKTGVLDYLENPWLEENLAFSFQMEKAAQEYYPGLTRKIYLKGYRYNMHVCPKTLLIELGAQNNTYEEALAACGPLASLLDHVLSGGEWTEAAIP